MKDIIYHVYLNVIYVNFVMFLQETNSNVLIHPDNLTVLEGRNATVRCTYDGQRSLQGATFALSDSTVATIFLPDCTSNALGIENYITDCEGNKTFTLTMINVSRHIHRQTVKCRVYLTNSSPQQSTNEAVVYINVPVKSLDITPVEKTIVISENKSINLNCISSYSRPVPLIRWIVSDEIDRTLLFIGIQKNLTNSNGFISAINSLVFQPKRTFNGWIIYCAVQITDVQPEEVRSSFIKLNITYPPESRLMINGYTEGGRYDVFDNETGTLNCTITGGNPKPILSWNKCFDEEKYIQWNNPSAKDGQTNMLTWQARSHTDRNCTCMSIHKERNDSTSITVNILCKDSATIREFFVGGHTFQSIVTADENDNITFICNVDSNPISNTSIRLTTGETLIRTVDNSLYYTIGSLDCLDTGGYLCYGKNKHSIGKISTRQLYLFVRCSPRANPTISYKINITSTTKNSPVLRFPVLAYPPPDIVTWQRFSISNWVNISSGSKFNVSRFDNTISLTINNMKEEDFGQYRLIITNEIGSYTQIFNVLKEAIMAENENTSLTGIVVGCSIGGVLLLFGLFMCLWIFRRLKLKDKHTAERSYQSTMALGSVAQDNKSETEFEYTNLDSTKTDRLTNEVHKTGTGTEYDSIIQYETLDKIRNESNQYSELSLRIENTDESIKNTSPDKCSKKLDTDKEKKIYMNMKI